MDFHGFMDCKMIRINEASDRFSRNLRIFFHQYLIYELISFQIAREISNSGPAHVVRHTSNSLLHPISLFKKIQFLPHLPPKFHTLVRWFLQPKDRWINRKSVLPNVFVSPKIAWSLLPFNCLCHFGEAAAKITRCLGVLIQKFPQQLGEKQSKH